jgi:hypothetical protein
MSLLREKIASLLCVQAGWAFGVPEDGRQQWLDEVVAAAQACPQPEGKAAFCPALATEAAGIMHRLDQAEARLTAAHPKAARDGQLAAMLSDIRDSATSLSDPESSLYTD